MEKRQLRIDVLGASFTIQSEESAEHLSKVSAYLREKVEEVKARYSFATPLTLALLAALNIADELVKERLGRTAHAAPASPAAPRELEEIAAGLIEQIDGALASSPPDDGDGGTAG
jgi:cell division protein ZapA (FtsZ GTPase activity inhibitor)